MASSTVSGLTTASFRAAATRIRRAAVVLEKTGGHGALMIAEEILTDVKASRPGAGVPFDKGALARSGMATPVGRHGALISFGSSAVQYALVQHEVTTYRHKLGEARYLVRGLERWKEDGSSAMAALRVQAQMAVDLVGRGV